MLEALKPSDLALRRWSRPPPTCMLVDTRLQGISQFMWMQSDASCLSSVRPPCFALEHGRHHYVRRKPALQSLDTVPRAWPRHGNGMLPVHAPCNLSEFPSTPIVRWRCEKVACVREDGLVDRPPAQRSCFNTAIRPAPTNIFGMELTRKKRKWKNSTLVVVGPCSLSKTLNIG